MSNIASIGICKVQFDPVCTDGQPDATRTPHVLCTALNIDQNNRIIDATVIESPSGMPGQNCLELELPGSKKPPEVVIDTCEGVFDPIFDALASGCNDAYFAEDGTFIGMAASPKSGDDCLCACEDATEACNRWDMTVWSRTFCPGSSGASHPLGKFLVTRYPNIEFQPQAGTISTGNSVTGRRYLAIAYEPTGPGYAGPADITPIELPFNSCVIGPFPSDQCPPGECGCGDCDAEATVPLARAARRRAAVPATSTPGADIPQAADLIDA